MDRIWQVRVPAHVGGDEFYFECYLAAVETKDEAFNVIRECGYSPEHVEVQQVENVYELDAGVFQPEWQVREIYARALPDDCRIDFPAH